MDTLSNSILPDTLDDALWYVPGGAQLPSGRAFHAAVGADDQLYVFGGITEASAVPTAEVSIFDTRTMKWARLSAPGGPAARSEMAFCLLGSRMFVYGGRAANGSPLDDLWAFDIDTRSWECLDEGYFKDSETRGPLPAAGASLCALGDLAVLIAEDDTWVWDTSLPSPGWQRAPGVRAPPPRAGAAASAVGGSIFYFGGRSSETGAELDDLWELRIASIEPGADAESIDPTAPKILETLWTPVQAAPAEVPGDRNAPNPRAFAAACTVGESFVLFGGRAAGAPQTLSGELWILEVIEGVGHWRVFGPEVASWPEPVYGAGLTTVAAPAGLRLILSGGRAPLSGAAAPRAAVWAAEPMSFDIYHMPGFHVSPTQGRDASPLRRAALPSAHEIQAALGVDETGEALAPPPLEPEHEQSAERAALRLRDRITERFDEVKQRVDAAQKGLGLYTMAISDEIRIRSELQDRFEAVDADRAGRAVRVAEAASHIEAVAEAHDDVVAGWASRGNDVEAAQTAAEIAAAEIAAADESRLDAHELNQSHLEVQQKQSGAEFQTAGTEPSEALVAALAADAIATDALADRTEVGREQITAAASDEIRAPVNEAVAAHTAAVDAARTEAKAGTDARLTVARSAVDHAIDAVAGPVKDVSAERVAALDEPAAAAPAATAAAAATTSRADQRLSVLERASADLERAIKGICERVAADTALAESAAVRAAAAEAKTATLAPALASLSNASTAAMERAAKVKASLDGLTREGIVADLVARTDRLVERLRTCLDTLGTQHDLLAEHAARAAAALDDARGSLADEASAVVRSLNTRADDAEDVVSGVAEGACELGDRVEAIDTTVGLVRSAATAAEESLAADRRADKDARAAGDALIAQHESAIARAAGQAASADRTAAALEADLAAAVADVAAGDARTDAALAALRAAAEGVSSRVDGAEDACAGTAAEIDDHDRAAERARNLISRHFEDAEAQVSAADVRVVALEDRANSLAAVHEARGADISALQRRIDDAIARVYDSVMAFRKDQVAMRLRVLGLDAAIAAGAADAATVATDAQVSAAAAVARAVDVEEKTGNVGTYAGVVGDRLTSLEDALAALDGRADTSAVAVAEMTEGFAAARATAARGAASVAAAGPRVDRVLSQIAVAKATAAAAAADVSAIAEESEGMSALIRPSAAADPSFSASSTAAVADMSFLSGDFETLAPHSRGADRGIVLSPSAASRQLPATTVLEAHTAMIDKRVGAIESENAEAAARLSDVAAQAEAGLETAGADATAVFGTVAEEIAAEQAAAADLTSRVQELTQAVHAARERVSTAVRMADRVLPTYPVSVAATRAASLARSPQEIEALVETAVLAEKAARSAITNAGDMSCEHSAELSEPVDHVLA